MIEIHTKRWRDDRQVGPNDVEDEPNDVSLHCRVVIDGREIENVIRARTRHDVDFAITTITIAQVAKIVNHVDGDTWEAIGKP